MENQIKVILLVIITIIIVGVLRIAINKPISVSPEKEPIKIGVILPLSGKAAQYGEEMKRGIELAIEEEREVPIKVIYEDSKFNPKEGLSAYYRLRIEDVSLMITAVSPVALAISPLADQEEVLQMAIAASTPEYTSPNDFSFRVTTRAEVEDRELVKWVINHGYRKIALMYVNNDWGLGHYNSIRPEIEKLGGELIGEQTFLMENTDFRIYLTKLKEQNPEAVFLLADAKTAATILKQSEELGIEIQFFGIRSLESKDLIAIAKEAAEGLIYTYPFDPLSENSRIKEFVEGYKNIYGMLPSSYVAEGYDAMNLLLGVLKKCNLRETRIDTLCMKEKLSVTKNYPGILGSLTFDENGDVYYPYFIKTVKNGKFVSYKD